MILSMEPSQFKVHYNMLAVALENMQDPLPGTFMGRIRVGPMTVQ